MIRHIRWMNIPFLVDKNCTAQLERGGGGNGEQFGLLYAINSFLRYFHDHNDFKFRFLSYFQKFAIFFFLFPYDNHGTHKKNYVALVMKISLQKALSQVRQMFLHRIRNVINYSSLNDKILQVVQTSSSIRTCPVNIICFINIVIILNSYKIFR